MSCHMCRERGQTWPGDPPKCAFDADGKFTPDNWNCATMNQLRDQIPVDHQAYSEDQKAGIIAADGRFLVLGWYKNRGRTEAFFVLDESAIRPGTQGDAALGLKR